MSEWGWMWPAWLFNRRVAAGLLKTLLWALLVVGVAVGMNVAGIHVVGSIDGWQRWLAANRGYFFAWRLLLYAATAYGWWRMRLREREPSAETHQRLRRVEIAALITLVLLEGSQLLRSG